MLEANLAFGTFRIVCPKRTVLRSTHDRGPFESHAIRTMESFAKSTLVHSFLQVSWTD